jgi:hypothetical protein
VSTPPFLLSSLSKKPTSAVKVIKKEIATEPQPIKPARLQDIPLPNQLRTTKPIRGEININQQYENKYLTLLKC